MIPGAFKQATTAFLAFFLPVMVFPWVKVRYNNLQFSAKSVACIMLSSMAGIHAAQFCGSKAAMVYDVEDV